MFFSGKPFKTGLKLKETNLVLLLKELREKRFNGVVCLTIRGAKGFEDGFLLIDSGKIVGCGYEYLKNGRKLEGKNAFPRFLNAAIARKGALDVIELTPDEIHSTLALSEGLLHTVEEKEIVLPKEFQSFGEDEDAVGAMQSSEGFFKKFKVKAF